jgi:hypothetical protein
MLVVCRLVRAFAIYDAEDGLFGRFLGTSSAARESIELAKMMSIERSVFMVGFGVCEQQIRKQQESSETKECRTRYWSKA